MFFSTALHIAIQADNKAIFDTLLSQSNLDLNLKTIDEHVPLYYALLKYESGDDSEDSYASNLISKGVHTDVLYSANCDSLLQKLIEENAGNAAIFLAGHVTNINHVNSEGETALHIACANNLPKVVDKLLEMNVNPNLLTNELRQTALHYAVKNNAQESIEVFIEKENCGANFNARDINSETPISLALNVGFKDLVPVLIKGNADVNVRNGKDFTLLHQAILKEDAKTAMFLLDNGADMNAK